MSQLSDAIQRHRQALLHAEETAATGMVQQYGEVLRRLNQQLEQLYTEIANLQALGQEISASRLFRVTRLETLLAQAEREFDAFAQYAEENIVSQQYDAVLKASTAAREITFASLGPLPPGYDAPSSFLRFNTLGVQDYASRISANSPVRELIESLAPQGVTEFQQVITQGMVQGKGLRQLRTDVQRVLDVPKARALTIARTEVLSTYREASIESYRNNDDVVEGWIWTAAKNRRTCACCLAMDGREFPNSVEFGSHPNCRCTPRPKTVSWADLGLDVPDRRPPMETAEQWFRKQPSDVQEEILGPSKFQRYQNGELQLEDFIGYRVSKKWGPNRWERSLKEIDAGEHKPPRTALGKNADN